ncbi:MAG: thymidine kinase [Candidatus Eisenbacteria bacterium]|nr:thymidine kinase [Candidatus Eisenbacteria bacterium]
MNERPDGYGWIEVIAGSMFSGKSEELIRRLRRAKIARQKIVAFKPRIDDRYDDDDIVSHDDRRVESHRIDTAEEILDYVDDETQVVGIDEGQFLGPKLPEVCEELANRGVRVIVAGLDQDYLGRPFEPMPALLAIAEYITKTLAVCMKCGRPANRTQRIIASRERVVVGAGEAYEARCRHCWNPEEASEDHAEPDGRAMRRRARERESSGRGAEDDARGGRDVSEGDREIEFDERKQPIKAESKGERSGP